MLGGMSRLGWIMAAAAAGGMGLGGCGAPEGPRELTVAPRAYGAAFEAAKVVLRDARFDLERVDARAGVITTAPKDTAGLASPWDGEQSTFRQEIEDVLNRQRRIVRITFEPSAVPPAPVQPGGPPAAGLDQPLPDVRASRSDLVMRVRVVVQRVERPGWRIDTNAIQISTYATDPALDRRGMQPTYAVAHVEDRMLGARLTRRIEQEMRAVSTAAKAGP